MNWLTFFTFCVLFSITAGDDHLRPGLLQEFYNVFNNLSNLASMPHLMATPDCQRDCEIYRQALHQNQMWAAEMYDANGRMSSGILKRNFHQIGHVNQCVSSSSKTSDIEGKVCFIRIFLTPLSSNMFMNNIWKNAFNLTMVTSKPYEKTFLPSSDVMVSSVCIPSSCTSDDVMVASRKVLSIFNQTTFGFEVHVDDLTERNCAVKHEYHANNPFMNFVKIFIFSMVILVICATIFDVFFFQGFQNDPNLLKIISKSFSLRNNYSILINVENDEDSIGFLNGFRCFTYFLFFELHYLAKFIFFGVDRTDGYTQFLRNPFVRTVGRNPWIIMYFLFFSSGISHSYKITKSLKRNDTKSILKSMLHKYLRFLTFWVIFFAIRSTSNNKTGINLIYTPREHKNSIWSILLCYENFNGVQNMYFGPAHTFYTDIQLYFVGCIILILTRYCENKITPILSIAFGSLVCRSIFLYFNTDIPAFPFFRMPFNQATDMMTYMFGTPFGIFPFYTSGIALGYYLRENSNRKITLSSLERKLGWMIALLCFGIAVLSFHPIDSPYEYNGFDGAVVSFIDSFCWIIFLSWMVFYYEIIQNSSVGSSRSFSSDIFVVLNRLIPYFSVLHIFVVLNNLADSRYLFEVKLSELLGLDYLFLSILMSAFVMLFLHLPLSNIWKIIITKKSNIRKKNSTTVRHKNE